MAGRAVEKAKTTPNAYPLTLNAVVTACNQKSNRFPLMELEADAVQESLDRLRAMGAVGLIQGFGRVEKFRHYMYEWLGVEKVELAVMTELLLRGPQTVGELRARAARMEPIHDLAELEPVVAGLKAKGLVVSLTPEGRGHVVTHALYPPREFERVKAEYHGASAAAIAAAQSDEPGAPLAARATPAARVPSPGAGAAGGGDLRREVDELRSQLAQVRSDVEALTASLSIMNDEIRRLRNELGG